MPAVLFALASALIGAASVTYTPPVDAPIVDHFRPPACTWCPGNRGIDYATAPGTPVAASAAGVVTFAGQVGGQLFVVIAHADGLRTTYAYLADVMVPRGSGGRPGFGRRHLAGIAALRRPAGRRLPRPGAALRRRAPRRPPGAARRAPGDAAGPRRRCDGARGPAGPERPIPLGCSVGPPAWWALTHGPARPVVALPGREQAAPPNRGRRRAKTHGPEPNGPGRHDAPAPRGRRPLRAPDPALEPEDEALHLR